MNQQDELHIRYPQDVIINESENTVDVTVRYSFNPRASRESSITIPGGSKDLLHDLEVVLATLRSERI